MPLTQSDAKISPLDPRVCIARASLNHRRFRESPLVFSARARTRIRNALSSSSPSLLPPQPAPPGPLFHVRMDRNESANEGGSSPDTVIARSSSEEERNRFACSTSGEYVTTVGDSSSSLDTVTSAGTTTTNVAANDPPVADDKKRGRFGNLKSSFRKEGGLFKIRRKNRQLDEPAAAEPEPDVEEKGFILWSSRSVLLFFSVGIELCLSSICFCNYRGYVLTFLFFGWF